MMHFFLNFLSALDTGRNRRTTKGILIASRRLSRCMNGLFLQSHVLWISGLTIVNLQFRCTMIQILSEDYRSGALWDEYIRYEESQQTLSHLSVIYRRILEYPIQQLDRYFSCV